jgi:hypothetical protein
MIYLLPKKFKEFKYYLKNLTVINAKIKQLYWMNLQLYWMNF